MSSLISLEKMKSISSQSTKNIFEGTALYQEKINIWTLDYEETVASILSVSTHKQVLVARLQKGEFDGIESLFRISHDL